METLERWAMLFMIISLVFVAGFSGYAIGASDYGHDLTRQSTEIIVGASNQLAVMEHNNACLCDQ